MSFFRVGQIVRNCRTETEALGKRFRLTSQLDFLADALQVDAHFLRDTQKLVDTYSEQEYVALIQQPSITWGHLLNLLAVPVAVEREKLVARVIAEKWSSNKLAREIHKQWPRPPQSPTRRVKPPQNLKAGLERAIRMAKSLSNTFDDALFGDQFDLTTRVLETAPDDVTPAMEQQVREAIETLARLSKTADENSRRLREALVWIEMVLKVRNSIPGGAGQLDVERDEGDAPRHR
ncbi:MAG TPA: hypothetical protein VHV55_05335 [Pirellulales bacterium]|jgi:hypothetical protein|nr:hypothetical protein [Pirellulales bacterium]